MASTMAERLARVAGQQTLKLTHHGRRTGKPYEVVIWFMVESERLYLATANVNRNWVRNVRKDPKVLLRVGGETLSGEVREITDAAEREHVQNLVQQKYWYVLPVLLAARMLTAFGILTDHTGAFEVRLDSGA
jgi:deazaflavin-dependent oxidoreductase (nitroreductase family)